MAPRSLSQTDRRATPKSGHPSPASVVASLLGALASAHRRRLGYEVARFACARETARPELGHALSWRFGVPVR
ncbi:MAG: hypothetical protein WAP03_05255 [Methylorubrum rhodinum]|uniref:hypothetical protein n=1 Tax=Methylorubrum rhodinum TaxID=29428 RepID=UPI003BAF8C66